MHGRGQHVAHALACRAGLRAGVGQQWHESPAQRAPRHALSTDSGQDAPGAGESQKTLSARSRRVLSARQKPSLQVVEAERKPGRPIVNRPQVDNLPDAAPAGSVSDTCDGSPRVVLAKSVRHGATVASRRALLCRRGYESRDARAWRCRAHASPARWCCLVGAGARTAP